MLDLGKRYEFHAHTYFSDGVLGPAELIRYALVNDTSVLALTDHVDFSTIENVIKSQKKMIDEISWNIKVLQGVELTHIPKDKIPKIAKLAKDLGADIVVAHGETTAEPVEPGTNKASVSCEDVDILAHPGNISIEDAETALVNDVFLELTARRGHNSTNGHVAEIAGKVGTQLLVNSDAHGPQDLVTQETAYDIAISAGLSPDDATHVVSLNPIEFLHRID